MRSRYEISFNPSQHFEGRKSGTHSQIQLLRPFHNVSIAIKRNEEVLADIEGRVEVELNGRGHLCKLLEGVEGVVCDYCARHELELVVGK